METKEPTYKVIIKGLAALGGIMGALGLVANRSNQNITDGIIDDSKRTLMVNHGFDSATIGDTKTKFFTPNKNVAIATRLTRMADSLDIKAKYPDWNSAKITSSLNYLRK